MYWLLNRKEISMSVISVTFMLALVPSLTRLRTLLVIALTSRHTCPWPRPITHLATTLFAIAFTIMLSLSPSLTHSTCVCTHHHTRSRALTQSLVLTLALSLTHSVYDYTHHDVFLPSLSLTCDCTRHYARPRPVTHFTCVCTHHSPPCFSSSPTHSFCCTCTHPHDCPHPLTNSLGLQLHVWLTLPSACDCTHHHNCPRPLTLPHALYSTGALYLWLHSLSCMLCLPSSSLTHSACDYTHHHTCVRHREWETGWSGTGLLSGDMCSVCDEICVHGTYIDMLLICLLLLHTFYSYGYAGWRKQRFCWS